MEALNADCLIKIFSKLKLQERIHLESICRRWYLILQQSCLYSDIKSIDVQTFVRLTTSKNHTHDEYSFEPILINIIRRCGPFVQEIDFGGCWIKVRQEIIDCIAKHCKRLKYLDLGCAIVDADITATLNNNSATLEYISLEDTSWTNYENESKVNVCLQNLTQLRNLNLRHFRFLPNQLLNIGQMLKELNLSAANGMSAKMLQSFINHETSELTELNLCPFPTLARESKANVEEKDGNDLQIVLSTFSKLKQLQALNIGYIAEIPQHCSMTSLEELTRLRFLHIQDCKCIDTSSLRAITTNLSHLRTLHLIKCPNIDNYSCLANVKMIRELEVRQSTEFHNSDIIRISMNGTLKRLRLDMCPNITNEAIMQLVKFCTKLKELELTKCENISENLFTKTDDWNNLKNIETISLNGTISITNKSIKELVNIQFFDSLQELDLSHNKNIDNKTIELFCDALLLKGIAKDDGKRRKKVLTIYVFQSGISTDIEENVLPEIELIF